MRVTIRVKKIVLGDASFGNMQSVSVVFERGGRQVATSSRDITVVDGDHHGEVEFNEDLILDVTFYGQVEEGKLVLQEKLGRLILRQNKGRGGVMGKELFQELGVVTLLLHQICALQIAPLSNPTQPYTLPIAKMKCHGSVMEVEITCIQMKSLLIDDDAMSDVSGYSDVSASSKGIFARFMGPATTTGGGRMQQPPTASSSSASSNKNSSGSSVTSQVDGLESRLAIMQMNFDRCAADRDNIEALHLETQRELAALKQQAADAAPELFTALPREASLPPPPPPSVESETLRIELKRLQVDAAAQQAEREVLASQLAGALAQAQLHHEALESERAQRLALQRQLEQQEQEQRQQLQGDGLQAELARCQPALRAQNAQLEELQRKDKITEGFILDKTRRLESQLEQAVSAEARLQSQLTEQAARYAQMVQNSSDATSQVYLQLAVKDREHGEALSTLHAQLAVAARERDNSKEMAQQMLRDKDREHGETMHVLQGQLAELSRAEDAAAVTMQRRVDALEAAAADHAAERAASLELIAALQLNSSDSVSKLSAQLSEQKKTHASEAKVWQVQLDAAASGHASIKAALLQQIAAAEMDHQRLAEAHMEELEALTRQLAAQSGAAAEAAAKTEFLQGCLRDERRAVEELRDELAEAQGRLDTMSAELEQMRITTYLRDEQYAKEIELLQRSALQQRALDTEGLSSQLRSVQGELLALQEAHLALQTHARGLESTTEDAASHRLQLAEQVVEMQAREAVQVDGKAALESARAEIASLQALLEEGEAAVRTIAAENREYAARNEALQAQQTLLSLEQMEKDASATNVVLQIASLRLQLEQQREEQATMESALRQQISELSDSVQAHSVITLEASLGIERERETSDLEALGQQFAEREREKERWAHEAAVATLTAEAAALREELREREIELEHTASALAGYLAGGSSRAKGAKGRKGGKGMDKDTAGAAGAKAKTADESVSDVPLPSSETESDTDDSMDGQGEAAYVQEKLDAANDALHHMSRIVDTERTKVMTIKHVLMKFTSKFTQADTELLLQAGVILEQQAPR